MELVPRRALVSRLLTSTEPLVLVSAPAGSGKTVTLTQWLAADERPSAWLRLDGGDNSPIVLLRGLAVALDSVVGIDAGLFELLRLRRPPLADRVLPGIAAAVAAARPFVLVVDDAQLVENEAAWAHVALVLDNMPEGAQLVIATRSGPPLPLGRLRASGALLELRFEDLAFDRDEAEEIMRLHGAGEAEAPGEKTNDAVGALLEATEGWATGLYLAALTGRGRSPDDWLPKVRGDQRAIADYLLGEVLERQPADLQHFLLDTSILGELTAPLCAAVTGRADAGAVLTRLGRENLFVSALDDHNERFRYHHLFADLLRSRLEHLGPDRLEGLHRRAAVWYEGHAELEPAIRHYLAAGDVAATPSLVERLFDADEESGRRVIGLYPEEQLLAYPALAISAGWVHTMMAETRDEERRWTRLMMDLEFEDGPTAATGFGSLRSLWLLLLCDLGPQGVGQMRRCVEEGLRIEDKPGKGRTAFEWYLAWVHYLSGSQERAERTMREALRGTQGTDKPVSIEWHAFNYSVLAHVAADVGRWDEAEESQAEAERLRPRMGLDEARHWGGWLTTLVAHLRVMSHRGDPGTLAFAWVIDDFMKDMAYNPPALLLTARVTLGEVALEWGDMAAARGWCDQALQVLAEWPDAGMLGRRARRLADALGRRVMAEPITPAEHRVLELLPTHLTVAHLADRLFLSPSTVKTHLRAIYRKLEVRTRQEAVERARELGVLKR